MSDQVKALMEMTDETVSAKHIAPILKMSPSVIVKYAKDGTWDADRLGKYVISGGHVKFFRKDFLQKWSSSLLTDMRSFSGYSTTAATRLTA